MKIALASDLHLEFGPIELKNTENAEVLILGGDIMIAQDLHDYAPDDIDSLNHLTKKDRANEFRNFLTQCSNEFPEVIYIAGNHEFYVGSFPKGIDYLKEECSRYSNIHFLENEVFVHKDITFIGCTLWTDVNKLDPVTVFELQRNMNDYRIIRNSDNNYSKLSPHDTFQRHNESVKFIRSVIESDSSKSYVVVGHHAPSKKSTKPRYIDSYHINGGYSSELSEFILNYPQIKLWTHGHTHDTFDYMIGTTRIVCNPRGYINHEKRADEFELKFLNVEDKVDEAYPS